MRVLIGPLVLSSGTYRVAAGGENPGIGGTEHVALQLAVRLSAMSDLEVTIGVLGQHREIIASTGSIPTLDLHRTSTAEQFDTCLTPVWQAKWLASKFPKGLGRRWVLWSHHPHDHTLTQLCSQLSVDAVVSCGGYQYLSNRARGVQHYWIPNPFPYWAERPHAPTLEERDCVVGHVGALVKAKGFHRIARHWRRAHDRLPHLRLQVIGSGALYGPLKDRDPELPMSEAYGRLVRRAFGGNSLPNEVDFVGLVDSKLPHIAGWRYAVQNLTGGSEAMPASVQELIAHGIPVIGSQRFGMWDFMRDFPEATVRRPRDFPDVLLRIERSPDLGDELVSRCQSVSERWKLYDQGSLIDAWISVLDGGRPHKPHILRSPPLPSQYLSLRLRVSATSVVESLRFAAHHVLNSIHGKTRRMKRRLCE